MSRCEPVTRWVEPCAGMLAVGLRLRGGEACIPPIAYLGGKRAFAGQILAGLGVRSGSGCRDLWLADAGPPGRVWQQLAGPEGPEVVRRLEAFATETPVEAERDLWEQLMAEPATLSGEDAAAWLVVAGWSYRAGLAGTGWAARSSDGGKRRPRAQLARLARLARLAQCAVAGAHVYRDARDIPREAVGRTVVLIDPPYVGTTGYAADLAREDVIALAREWYDAGAEVVITEREPVVPAWRAVRLDRAGGPRALWEYATLSPNVRWQTGEALTLFGADPRAPDGSVMIRGVCRRRPKGAGGALSADGLPPEDADGCPRPMRRRGGGREPA